MFYVTMYFIRVYESTLGCRSWTPAQKLVYSTVQWFSELSDGIAYPSISSIAEKSGVSWRTAQWASSKLSEQGYFTRKFGCNRQSYSYVIEARPAFTSKRKEHDGYIELTRGELQGWNVPINIKFVFGCLKRFERICRPVTSIVELSDMAGVKVRNAVEALLLMERIGMIEVACDTRRLFKDHHQEIECEITL